MEFTIYKSIIGAANVIRLLKCSDKYFNSFTSFALPSIQSASVIVKATVVWNNLQFWVSLTCYEEIEEGLKAINDIYTQQASNLPDLPTNVSRTLIEVEALDLSFLEIHVPNCKPIPSVRHIMFQSTSELAEENIYKILYDPEEICLFTVTSNVCPSPTRFIYRQLAEDNPYVIYSYEKVPYGPLSINEVSECLKNLLLSIKEALDELHSCSLRHNDLRLPNVCFNSEYKAILIDLDACTRA